MTEHVPAEGPAQARVMLVGECPGASEVEQGRPFVGGAGRVLDGLLAEVGIDRATCHVTNVMQTRPLGNDFGHFYEDRQRKVAKVELAQGIERLGLEIAAVRPNVVVALGAEALRALTGHRSIGDWRGSVLKGPGGVKVVGTYHPAAIMRQWSLRPVAVMDLRKVVEEAEGAEYDYTPPIILINPPYEETLATLQGMHEAGAPVAFDIEVELGQINSIAFSDGVTTRVVGLWFGASGSLWTLEQELELWLVMKSLLESDKVLKIAQNAQYDMAILADTMGIHVRGLWMDTLVAHHTAYPEMPASLGFLTSVYTDHPYYKFGLHATDMMEFFRYNGMDALVTWEVAQELQREMQKLGVWEFYERHPHKLIGPLLGMSRRGVRIDVEAREQVAREVEAALVEKQGQLDVMVGHPLNVASPKQMLAWLYEELKLPGQRRMRKGKPDSVTADDEALRELNRQHGVPAIPLVLEIREGRKLLGTYLLAPLSPDGRIRCSYKIHGTETGRLSSGKWYDGLGSNLQNVPKGVARRMFVADPGHVLIEADLSQAEARVVAYLAEDTRLIQAFEVGGDIHRRVAGMLFGKDAAQVTAEERQTAKRCVHGLNYGMQWATFAKWAEVTAAEAKRVRALYFSAFPMIGVWHQKVAAELRKSRWLSTPMGRRRLFLAQYNEQLVKEALAYVPQSTVADVTNVGLLAVDAALPGTLLMQVHDAVVLQVPREQVEEAVATVRRCMTVPVRVGTRTLVIPVDIKTGGNWADVEEVRME